MALVSSIYFLLPRRFALAVIGKSPRVGRHALDTLYACRTMAIYRFVCYMHTAYEQSQIFRKISRHETGRQPAMGA